jgi:hypothetical protein
VGSVGRVQDFTRSFLPTNPADEERWSRLTNYILEGGVVPPIEVYKLGDAYFVIDGNHRVSIARQLGHQFIEANVTEVKTRVPLSHDDDPQEILCKARYAEFLEQTRLDELRPGSNLKMTFCDQYELLLSQIEVHSYLMWLETEEDAPYPDVVAHWYDQLYLPIVSLIRQQELASAFPERSEADLYVLMTEHRRELEKRLGKPVQREEVAEDLAHERSTVQIWLARLRQRFKGLINP